MNKYKTVQIGFLAALVGLALGYALFATDTRKIDADAKSETSSNLAVLKDMYAIQKSTLPPHQLYCIPEKKSYCTLKGCDNMKPSVFILLESSPSGEVSMSRCDDKPCDTFTGSISTSGETMEFRSDDNHGLLFKTISTDQSYIEVVTLGTDAFVSTGHCYKKQ